MHGLIIAAGLGSRLSGLTDSKPLLLFKGKPLIERVIQLARSGGCSAFHVVTGYNREKVETQVARFCRREGIQVEFIYNEEWRKPNGISVHCAKNFIQDPFFLLMSDHLFDPSIMRDMAAEGIAKGQVKLAVDSRVKDNPLIDLDDVTKVWTDQGAIREIGKNIFRYNAFDTGIFFCTPGFFDVLTESIAAGDASLSGAMRVLARSGQARIYDIGGRVWLDIDDPGALLKAENLFD